MYYSESRGLSQKIDITSPCTYSALHSYSNLHLRCVSDICGTRRYNRASLEASTSAAALPFLRLPTNYNPDHDICAPNHIFSTLPEKSRLCTAFVVPLHFQYRHSRVCTLWR
jgi:hypothetical protein